jgi:ribosomal protein L20
MPRAKRGFKARRRRKKILSLARGMYDRRRSAYGIARGLYLRLSNMRLRKKQKKEISGHYG